MTQTVDGVLEALLRKEELSTFLYHEASLLDSRRWRDWLGLVDRRITYRMPLRLNVKYGSEARSLTVPGEETCWFDDTYDTLESRVDQILTGVHWAEEPASRATRLLSNIQVVSYDEPLAVVTCSFLLYRNRVADETDILVGRRTDTLTKESGEWRLLDRLLLLDQNVLTAKNLTLIF
ncbi:MAG TPA: 3-phenylpropionate/cinnamic acid dioxygenase subunit beta [Propionibacteriaceae bacterium]|nr:3-phenylpropionate/cinnamic acid dioxygenase subunit beta [Propionibacteriaceae bacterium]